MTTPQDPYGTPPEGEGVTPPPPPPPMPQPGGMPAPGAVPPSPPATPGYGTPPTGYGTPPAVAPGYGTPPQGPAAPASGPRLADWGTRVASALVDGVVPLVLVLIGVALRSAAGIVIFYLLAFAFTIWNLVRQGRTGQTIGKTALKTSLRKEADGSYVGAGLSIGRAILHVVDSIPCYLGYLWPLWDAKRQTFADKIVGTLVIKE